MTDKPESKDLDDFHITMDRICEDIIAAMDKGMQPHTAASLSSILSALMVAAGIDGLDLKDDHAKQAHVIGTSVQNMADSLNHLFPNGEPIDGAPEKVKILHQKIVQGIQDGLDSPRSEHLH